MNRILKDLKEYKIKTRGVLIIAFICVLLISGIGYIWYKETDQGSKLFRRRTDFIGIIRVNEPILSSEDSLKYVSIINKAIVNDSIKAIVLSVDSPGGSANQIEQIYLDLLELKKKKPLVAYMTTALSGGYYISVAADYLYTHPTSMVGNVGVIGMGPETLVPSEKVLETGPYKATGYSKLLFPFNLTHALDKFESAVFNGRGDKLKLSSTQLRKGMIYLGEEAVGNGMADEIGSLQKSVEKSAEEAGLKEYGIVDLTAGEVGSLTSSNGIAQGREKRVWSDLNVETLNQINKPPAVYHLYLPTGSLVHKLNQDDNKTQEDDLITPIGGGKVIIDKTHGNLVSIWELDILLGELSIRNVSFGFINEWDELEAGLNNASCLIVASPSESYSVKEVGIITSFVEKGGQLLLFFDPATQHVDLSSLHGPINSLSNRFGVYYLKGYLYNQEEHFGFYRNIYIEKMAENNLTKGVSRLVLFTATSIKTNNGIAWTSPETFSSTAEIANNYTTIATSNINGSVIAFGDITFLMEPYCYVEDNYLLITNLAESISDIQVQNGNGLDEKEKETLEDPDLPVGTEKVFDEEIDGTVQTFKWFKESETEVLVERPNSTTLYNYDPEGALLGWYSDNINVTYDIPVPESPYPLEVGETWSYEGTYDITIEGETFEGKLVSRDEVTGFDDVEAGNEKKYRCAEIKYSIEDEITRESSKITIIITGRSWISQEVGTVKEDSTIQTYVDGIFVSEENREMILKSIQRG